MEYHLDGGTLLGGTVKYGLDGGTQLGEMEALELSARWLLFAVESVLYWKGHDGEITNRERMDYWSGWFHSDQCNIVLDTVRKYRPSRKGLLSWLPNGVDGEELFHMLLYDDGFCQRVRRTLGI